MKTTLCIYHKNCPDGFGAAWVVRRAIGADRVKFFPGVYNEPPPDCTGRHVILVDICYPPETLSEITQVAQSLLIIDHHKTAFEWVEGFESQGCPVSVLLAEDKSSALLAKMHYFPVYTVAWPLINYISDRDTCTFALPETRNVMAAVFSYPYDFYIWDNLMRMPIEELEAEGCVLNREFDRDLALLLEATQTRACIAGYDVPCANLPPIYASEAGHRMSQGEPFSVTWYDGPTYRHFSLRSAQDGLDVAKIAEQFGGGGHKHAAWFRREKGDNGLFAACASD
jgi:hypothetical protein